MTPPAALTEHDLARAVEPDVPAVPDRSAGRSNRLLLALCALPFVFLPMPWEGAEMVFLVPKLLWLMCVLVPLSVSAARSARVPWRVVALPSALVATMTLALLGHDDPVRSLIGAPERLDGLSSHAMLLAVAFGGAAIWRTMPGKRIEEAFAALGVALALVVVAQRFGLIGRLSDPVRGLTLADLPSGTIGNRGYSAALLATLLPFVIVGFSRSGGWRSGAAVGGVALALGLGWARGPILAGVVGLVVCVAAASGMRRRAALGVVIAILGLAAGTLVSGSGDNGGQSGSTHLASTTDSGRKPLWGAALHGARTRPLTGFGADGVLLAMARQDPVEVLAAVGVHAAPGTARFAEPTDARQVRIDYPASSGTQQYENVTTKVHNELLDYAVSWGLPAALLAAATLVWSLRSLRVSPSVGASIAAAAAAMLTWPQVMRTAPIVWALLGMGLAAGADRLARQPGDPTATGR